VYFSINGLHQCSVAPQTDQQHCYKVQKYTGKHAVQQGFFISFS